MDYEILGFLKANKNRLRVLEMLASAEASEGQIAHKLRMSSVAVRKTLKDLTGRGLIEPGTEEKEGYKATEKGIKSLRSLAR